MIGEVPTISKELQGVTAKIGEDATFSCELSQPGLEVKWSKDGKSIRKSQKYEISQEQMLIKLTIHNITDKDSGEYSCEVTGGPTSKAKLEIKGKVFKPDGLSSFIYLWNGGNPIPLRRRYIYLSVSSPL